MKVRQISKFTALALSVIAAVSMTAGCSKQSAGPGAGAAAAAAHAVPVNVVTVEPHPVQVQEQISGRTVSYRIAEVRPQVNGVLQKRLFTEGQMVKAGQPLYQIDASVYNANVQSAKASLAQAEAALALARANAARSATLVKENAVSKQSDDTAQAQVRTDEAAVKAARAALTNAQINVQYTYVRAPISALMTAYQSQRMTVIHQLDPIYVDVQRTTAELLKLREELASGRLKKLSDGSTPVKIMLEDGTVYPITGKLTFQGVSVGTDTGTVTLRAEFPNPKGTLLPGMYVRAVLPSGDIPQAITLNQHAVMRDMRGDPYVFVVNKDNKVEQRAIKTGEAIGDQWIVNSGLNAGDRVIVEGIGKVRPGALVAPSEGSAAASAPAASAPASAPASSAAAQTASH